MTKRLTTHRRRIQRKADGLAVRRRPLASTQFGTFAGVLEEGQLLPEREVFDSRCGAAENECPEEKEERLKDAHNARLSRLANGQSYSNEAATPNGRHILPDQMQNS